MLFLRLPHIQQVYISPGISGVSMEDSSMSTDLNPAVYDWRNPMVKVEIMAEELDDYSW